VNPKTIPLLELQRIAEQALARGANLILVVEQDGHQESVRVSNAQTIEVVRGHFFQEAA